MAVLDLFPFRATKRKDLFHCFYQTESLGKGVVPPVNSASRGDSRGSCGEGRDNGRGGSGRGGCSVDSSCGRGGSRGSRIGHDRGWTVFVVYDPLYHPKLDLLRVRFTTSFTTLLDKGITLAR
jgi:hypothetical protein